ncbi:MAG: multicopper oxidase domain-containing protein [Bacteroides sp.]|nr:multicopper oxidase domain-containing protein [Bacteroides sp.]
MKIKISFILILNVLPAFLLSQNPLLIPDTLSGISFELTLQNGTFSFYNDQSTTSMGVNGHVLGPTLILEKGDFVDIKVNNQLTETTTIHWHGLHVSAANDGGPHTAIAPSEVWNPGFTVLDKAGTYWYHPHLHENTNRQVSLGIAGLIIVRDEEEAALELPRTYGMDDFPLVIQTKDFDINKQIVVPSNSDDILMVNATIDPYLNVPAQVVRLRLLNGSSQRVFNVGLSGNQAFYQIASDGGLLKKPELLTRLRIAPGERAEILIDFSGMAEQSIHLMSYASELQNGTYGAVYPGMGSMMSLNGYNPNPLNGNNFNILKFEVVAPTKSPVHSIPENLADVKRVMEISAGITRTLTITPGLMGPNQLNGDFLINGLSFDMELINFSIPLNSTEIWSISNRSSTAHPFHIHDVQFYVLDRNGIAPPANEQGRKDVILIHPMETVRLITQFTDFANDTVPYMLHCHMLTHEDQGMMLQFEVVDLSIGTGPGQTNPDLVKVYPNPVKEGNTTLTISGFTSEKVLLGLYNMQGQKISEKNLVTNKEPFTIKLPGILPGTYLLKLNGGNIIHTTKIVVE